MAFTESPSQLFNTRDFGVAATLTDVSESTTSTINGIFDNESALVDVGDVEVEATVPRFYCLYTDVSSAVEGDTLAISGTTYTIAGPIIKDESGIQATLILKD